MPLTPLTRRSSIHQRILLLALIPTLLTGLLLFGVSTHQRLSDARADLVAEAELLLDSLSPSAAYGLRSGDRDFLRQLSQPALADPDVRAISYLDARGQPLVGRHRLDPLQQPHRGVMQEGWRFHRPIRRSATPAGATPAGAILGYVVLEMEPQRLARREQQIIQIGLLITLGATLLALLLALAISTTISRPLRQLSQTVELLRRGDLSARAKVDDPGELGELADGINNLAGQVQRTQSQLEGEVVAATRQQQRALAALEAQNRVLEQANHTKDEFLARMSHELRTPLTSVQGFVRLLTKTSLDATQREYTRVVERTSETLLNLIDDLLDFSKLASDAIHLERLPFSLDACIEEVLEQHLPSARSKGIDLVFVPDPALPEQVCGDPTRLSQVLNNLIGNAVKFTLQGEVAVTLAAQIKDDQVAIRLEVSDTGIGIDAAQQAQLFQPFSQADSSISRRFGGSGLGLVISRRLIELMGGSLSLYSAPGEGTRVRLAFQLEVVAGATPAQLFKALPVLLYDRRPLSRRALQRRLEHLGCVVTLVRHRRQLLTLLAEQGEQYQRLILSLSRRELRALKGAELLQPIRQRYRRPLILIANLNQPRLAAELQRELQPLQLLGKPFTSSALAQALHGLQPAPSAPASTPHDLEGVSVLVAEDNPFNQMLLGRILEMHGAHPLLVDNGREALAVLANEAVDLVLMDIHMPAMDGLEAIRAIRALPGPEARIPIITLTAGQPDRYAEQTAPLGIRHCLGKPIDEPHLIAAIAEACGIETAPPALAAPLAEIRLSRYGISDSSLQRELSRQLGALQAAYRGGDSVQMRDHSHQLMGLAGLLGLTEIDATALAFNQAVKGAAEGAMRVELARLARLIEQAGTG